MNTKQLLQLFAILFLFIGCAALETGGFLPPSPTQSEYLYTTGAGFSFIAGNPDSIQYIISLNVMKSRERDLFIEARFEDPSSPKNPIIITYTLQPEELSFMLKSSPVYGLRSYEGYVIDIFIYEDSTKTNLLGKHRQVVQSIIDQNRIDKNLKQKE